MDWGLGIEVWGLWFVIWGLGVWGLRIGDWGLGFEDSPANECVFAEVSVV